MMLKNRCFVLVSFIAVVASAMAPCQVRAADNAVSAEEKQRALISVLRSDAPPQDKAVTCKQLAVYGTKDAVPVLAPLLADERLASWARIALEVIPDAAAGQALNEAMGNLQGKLLIGVINSIGVRRDLRAVAGLAQRLKDPDAAVASAAAVALGHISGERAAKALLQSLANAPDGIRPAVAEGCILCAERFLAAKQFPEAVKLYDAVRKANVPKQKLLQATRGAVLARQSAGLPLLLEQLRSEDKGQFGMALHTARELPGRKVTEALAAELDQTSPARQVPLLLALADRDDAAVFPAVLGAAKSGPKKLRIAAIGALERSGNAASVPVLLAAAGEGEADLAKAAKAAMIRLSGQEVDSDLLARLPQASGKNRQVLIEVAGQRQIRAALPAVVQCAEDADAGVRAAAVEAIGILGEDKQAADLVKLLQKTQTAKERADLEKALLALSGRCGTGCVPHLLPLAQSDDSALRTIALHALSSVGGSDALAAVKSAIDDKEEAVQDEAVRTLATWAQNWPEDVGVAEPLLELVKSGKKTSHQVLGLRGYLQYIQGDKKLNNDEKVAKIDAVLPFIKRLEEKRLVIAVIGTLPAAGVLEPLIAFAEDPAIAEEACSAIVSLAEKNIPGVSSELRQKALQTVVDKSKNDATRNKANEVLKGIK